MEIEQQENEQQQIQIQLEMQPHQDLEQTEQDDVEQDDALGENPNFLMKMNSLMLC